MGDCELGKEGCHMTVSLSVWGMAKRVEDHQSRGTSGLEAFPKGTPTRQKTMVIQNSSALSLSTNYHSSPTREFWANPQPSLRFTIIFIHLQHHQHQLHHFLHWPCFFTPNVVFSFWVKKFISSVHWRSQAIAVMGDSSASSASYIHMVAEL